MELVRHLPGERPTETPAGVRKFELECQPEWRHEKISNRRSGDLTKRMMRTRRLAFALWLTACSTWRPVQLAPTPGFHEKEHVRVVRSNGSRIELASPSIVDDSLVGLDRVP